MNNDDKKQVTLITMSLKSLVKAALRCNGIPHTKAVYKKNGKFSHNQDKFVIAQLDGDKLTVEILKEELK